LLRKIFQMLALSLAIFLALEISLRLVYFGADALSPEKMNSHVLILDSDFVKASDYPDIHYDLKPDIDSIFRGKNFRTNSRGMPDREYPVEKPADVYRIAVIGSSWSMPTGVDAEKAYHVLLEEKLATQSNNKSTEVLNFAVEYYGLGEMVATVEHKALAYDPDLIIFAITSITPNFLWEAEKDTFTKADTVPPFFRSYVSSALMEAAGKRLYASTQRPKIKNPYGSYMRQIRRSMEALKEQLAGRNTEVAVIWLSFEQLNASMKRNSARHANDQGFRFISVNLIERAEELGYEGGLLTGKIDGHPNELAHRVIAETLHKELFSKQQ
jgi:hypothetical protein